MVDNLTKSNKLLNKIFNNDEIQIIKTKIKKTKPEYIIYCSFENRFAKSGGLGAVTQTILPYLNSYNPGTKAILITPFYSNIINEKSIKKINLKTSVPFDNNNIETEILEYNLKYSSPKNGKLNEYYIKAKGFFNSKNSINDPYIYDQNNTKKNNENLLLNSLFYCKAVPYILNKLKIKNNIIFHLQDWQTGLTALTSKEALLNNILESCSTTITLHNSYDQSIDKKYLKKITSRLLPLKKPTVLQIALQLADTPITTVSKNFSKEFTKDKIQKENFAPHLQKIFKQIKITGVNNGMFIDFPEEYKNKKKLNIKDIKTIKNTARKKLLEILEEYPKTECFGELTYKDKSITHLPDTIPIFVMTGRLDFSQKGYDVFLMALKKIKKDHIKAVLTPKPVKDSDLNFFKKITKECKGNIIVFPKNMTHGFGELQMGSTFGIMPSIYEPFGAAVEYMVKGTVVIARKTGGLINQINSNCGILYRESSDNYTLENIINFSKAGSNIKKRANNKWVKDMTDALYITLNQAKNTYQNKNYKYYRMIKNGLKKAKKFSWQKSAKKYFKIYKKKFK